MITKVTHRIKVGYSWFADSKAGAVLAIFAVLSFMGFGLPGITNVLLK
jgi:hypothetical protein